MFVMQILFYSIFSSQKKCTSFYLVIPFMKQTVLCYVMRLVWYGLVWFGLFNGTSTFLGYLMPKPSY